MEYNDYELIYMAKDDNDEAIDYLYKKYEPLFNKKATKVYNILRKKGIEFEDVKQECLIAFEKAINNFNPNDKVLFYTFVNICIDRQLKSFILKQTKDKHKVLNEAVSLDVVNDEGEEVSILNLYGQNKDDPEYNLLNKESEQELSNLIKTQLTAREELIFDLKMQGFSYKEISEIIDKDSKVIYNTSQRIKNKIIKILEER